MSAMATSNGLRRLPRALRQAHALQRTCIRGHATASAAAEYPERDGFIPDGATLPPLSPIKRRRDLSDAKPFSDFLTDTFNRQHDYLRISLTERCNLRCLYCMPEEGIQLSPSKELLTSAEIYYLSALFVNQGVNKIRLTGGEPTVRKDIVPLMQQIGSLRRNGLKELALTTNGISLHRKLDAMVEAGLTGVNISLDTLDPFQFQLLTRRQGFDAVMKSIKRVQEMNGLGAKIKLKVNAVVMRGLNDHQILPFVEKTRDEDIEVRFIEYMPFGGNKWSENKMLPYAEMVELIRAKYPGLARLKDAKNDTSKTYQIPGFKGRVGFITSMTHNFCGTCNRLRITSDGNLKVCLHGNTEVSLRDLLRSDHAGEPLDEAAFEAIRELELDRRKPETLRHDGDEGWISKEQQLLEVIGAAVKRKKAKHAGMGQLENMKNRPMILIDEARKPSLPSVQSRQRHAHLHATRNRFQIPFHLLASSSPTSSQIRFSSTQSSNTTEEEHNTSSPRESQATQPNAGGESLFQSLAGLFAPAEPTRRYSRPSESRLDSSRAQQGGGDAIDVLSGRPAKKQTLTHDPEMKEFGSVKAEHDQEDFTTKPAPGNPDVDSSATGGPVIKKRGVGSRLARRLNSDSSTTGVSVVRKTTHNTVALRSKMHVIRGQEESLPHFSNSTSSTTTQHYHPADDDDPDWQPFFGERVDEIGQSSHAPVTSASDTPDIMIDQAAEAQSTSGPEVTPSDVNNSHLGSSDSTPAHLKRSALRKGRDRSLRNSSSEPVAESSRSSHLTHLKSTGEAHMVDVGSKPATKRVALALATLYFSNGEPIRLISENMNKKGDVLGVARIAGIMAAKKTSDLIPLCHPIPLSKVEVDVERMLLKTTGNMSVQVLTQVECTGPTGVEMEALTAATVAAMTVVDMCKAVDRDIRFTPRVVYKAGGKSGLHVHRSWAEHQGPAFFAERGLESPWESQKPE